MRAADIDWRALQGVRTVGVTAGASAPQVLVDEVIAAFRDRYDLTVEIVETAQERLPDPTPPDLTLPELDGMVAVARRRGIEGMIVSNTTIARPESLRSGNKAETGGLSGAPLLAPSTALLRRVFGLARGRLTLILRGKRFGFSLDAIGRLLDLYQPGTDNAHQLRAALDLARGRLAEMRNEHADLLDAIKDLESQIALTRALSLLSSTGSFGGSNVNLRYSKDY